MQNLQKIPVKTKAGTFVLEMSAKGLYAVRFPSFPQVARGTLRFKQKMSVLALKKIQKLDLTGYTPFQLKVYAALRKIPEGKVITYGELARKAGYPGAARAVGSAMKKNRLPIVIPCHRVVPADGSLGQYSCGIRWKKFLLEWERRVPQSRRATRHTTVL